MGKSKSVEAVATTLSLIEYLASAPAPVRLKDVADHLNIPGSKAHRHLSTLRAQAISSEGCHRQILLDSEVDVPGSVSS